MRGTSLRRFVLTALLGLAIFALLTSIAATLGLFSA